MLCEKCKKNFATVHYRYNDNGNVTEIHLCSECAKSEEFLFDSGFSADKNIFGEYPGKTIMSSLFNYAGSGKYKVQNIKICPGCGLTENELKANGKLGCEKCYSVFLDMIGVMLEKMHMSSEYKGKIPEKADRIASIGNKIEKLKEEMQNAVERQEYEEAAKIRDAIKSLEIVYKDNKAGGKDNEVV